MIKNKDPHEQMCNFIGRKNTLTTEQNIEKIKEFLAMGASINRPSPFDKHNKEYPLNIAITHSPEMLDAILSFKPFPNHHDTYSLFLAIQENNTIAFDHLLDYFTDVHVGKPSFIERIKNTLYLTEDKKSMLNVYGLALIKDNHEVINRLNSLGINENDIKPEEINIIVSHAIKTCNIEQAKMLLPLLFKNYSTNDILESYRFSITPLYSLSMAEFKPFIKEIFSSLPQKNNDFLYGLAQNIIDKSGLSHYLAFKEIFTKEKKENNLDHKVSTLNAFVKLVEQKKINKIEKIIQKGVFPTVRTEHKTTCDKETTSLLSAWYIVQKNNPRKNYNEEFLQIYLKNPGDEDIFFIPKNDIYASDNRPAVKQLNVITAALDLYENEIPNPLSLFIDKELPLDINKHNLIKSICFSNLALDNSEIVKIDIEKIVNNFSDFNDEDSYIIFDNYPDLFLKVKEKQNINPDYFAEQYVKRLSLLFKPTFKFPVESELEKMLNHFNDNIFTPELILEKFEKLNVNLNVKQYLEQLFYPTIEKYILQQSTNLPNIRQKMERI